MKVLQLTVHLFPNVGGVETHLKDLVSALVKRDFEVFVLAYQPLSTRVDWKIFEKTFNLTILRIPWIRGFFEKLVYHPLLEFIYLVPGLFLVTPIIIFWFRPDVIHAHGLSAAVSAVFWGKVFGIRTILSIHSFYGFPKKGLYRDFVKKLFINSDFILSLSRKSNQEVKSLGIKDKTGVFTYWIDLNKFKRVSDARKKLKRGKEFIVLFVGRLVLGKGIKQLLESTKLWDRNIHLFIIGSGPLENWILQYIKQRKNVSFLGKIDQDELPAFYSTSDCVVVPSTAEEGFGRVIIESLACDTPVIASRKGATTEAMNETVGKFIEPTPKAIKENIEYFYKNPSELKKLARNSRKFAERRYSEKNVEAITRIYTS